MSGNRQAVIETDLENFFENTPQLLQDLSRSNHAYIHFRTATSISLLFDSPDTLLAIYRTAVPWFFMFLGRQPSALAVIAVCCLFGALLLLLMPEEDKRNLTIESISRNAYVR